MQQVQCPICDAAMPGNRKDYPDYPFCSRRCRLVDLGRWLGEGYRVGGPDADDRSTPADADDAR
jgi:endogenous inhibitor of DNA gyrase (YacG/DUF329 family)